MNKIIFNMLANRFKNPKVKLMISSLSYYAILALIPTALLTTLLLKTFEISIYLNYQFIFDKLSLNLLSSTLISLVTIYMIARIFFVILKDKFSLIKCVIFSISFALFSIIFLTIFLSTYTLENNLLSISIKLVLTALFFFFLIFFASNSNLKYSLIFSFCFSIISNIFLYVFILATSFFLNYENYYGLLAPIFLIILAIHFFIYLVFVAYIGAEEFTKISNMKILKS